MSWCEGLRFEVTSWLEQFLLTTQMRYDNGGFCSRFSADFAVRTGLCNRLQRLPLSLSSFSITLCSCAGHQMTSSPPEDLSSFFISAAAWLSPGQQPATQGEGTSACVRIRDRLPHFPSVSPSDCAPHAIAPPPPPTFLPLPLLPPCYSRKNSAIWYVALFVPGWSDWQRGLRRKHYMHDLQQKASCLLHKTPDSIMAPKTLVNLCCKLVIMPLRIELHYCYHRGIEWPDSPSSLHWCKHNPSMITL